MLKKLALLNIASELKRLMFKSLTMTSLPLTGLMLRALMSAYGCVCVREKMYCMLLNAKVCILDLKCSQQKSDPEQH